MIGPNELMSDLADRGENPDCDDARFYLEIDRENRQAIVCFVEPLQFHADYAGAEWLPLVDEDGTLKRDVAAAVAERLQAFITSRAADRVVTVEHADHLQHDDEPSLGLEIVAGYEENETFTHWLDRIGWPAIATTINVTDPGTWNSPYLFSVAGLTPALSVQ